MKKEQPAPEKFKLDDFFTKQKAEVGTRLNLDLPDGTPTGEWLVIVSNESDTFRRARSISERSAVEISKIEDEDERDDAIYGLTVDVCARCVINWSLEAECTFENVKRLLSNSAYIKRRVDVAIGNRALFFARS